MDNKDKLVEKVAELLNEFEYSSFNVPKRARLLITLITEEVVEAVDKKFFSIMDTESKRDELIVLEILEAIRAIDGETSG